MSFSTQLNEGERQFLELAITCMKTPPELDMNKIAEIMGVKPKSASNKWWEIRKKLFTNAPETASTAEDEGEPVPSTPSTGGKRKRAAKPTKDEETPTKKPRGRPRGSATKKTSAAKGKTPAKVKKEDLHDDADDQELSADDHAHSDDMDVDLKHEAVKEEDD
ncbi:hypothetical protein V8F20_006455 [Naviculisporaceae sp. PSN 640]